jgi:hypothetical protein
MAEKLLLAELTQYVSVIITSMGDELIGYYRR